MLYFVIIEAIKMKKKIFNQKTPQIFDCLQSLLINVRVFNLASNFYLQHFTFLYHIIICDIQNLKPQCQIFNTLYFALSAKSYRVNTNSTKLRLKQLKPKNTWAPKIKVKKFRKTDLKNFDTILHYQGLFFILETIWIKWINKHYNNLWVEFFHFERI